MKKIILTALVFISCLLMAASPDKVNQSSDNASKVAEKVYSYIVVEKDGFLSLDNKAFDEMHLDLVDFLSEHIATVNEEIANGVREPILNGVAPRPAKCDCLLGCCQDGYCYLYYPNYISKEPCQP